MLSQGPQFTGLVCKVTLDVLNSPPCSKLDLFLLSSLQLAFAQEHVFPSQFRATQCITVLLLRHKDGAFGSQSAGGKLCCHFSAGGDHIGGFAIIWMREGSSWGQGDRGGDCEN